MKKHSKSLFLTVLLAVCFAVTTCLLFACGSDGNKDSDVTYTVTVKKDAETPASGVKVQLRKNNTLLGDPVATGTDGKVAIEAAPDTYTVRLTNLPANHSIPDGTSLTVSKDNPNLTVTLQKDFVYTVKLVKPDGTPFYAQGVQVGICKVSDGQCLSPVDLGTNGIATISGEKSSYHVQIAGLSAAYHIDVDEKGYCIGAELTGTVTEATVTVYEVSKIDLDGKAMSDEDKTAFAALNSSYDADAQERTAYKGEKQLTAKNAVCFSVTPKITGKYKFFTSGSVTWTASWSGGNFVSEYTLEADKTYLFTAKNNGDQAVNAQFVLAVPSSSYIVQSGKGADLDLELLKASDYAVVVFTPTEAGTYTLTVQGETVAYANVAKDEATAVGTKPQDSDYKKGASAEIIVAASKVAKGLPVYFAVTVKADSYPVTANIKIVKTQAGQDKTTDVTVTETLSQFDKPADKELCGVPLDGTANLVKNGNYYYYNDKQVVVNITGYLDSDRFYDSGMLAYLDSTEQGPPAKYTYNQAEEDQADDILDYQKFLRGFTYEEYASGKLGLMPPEDISTEVYYAKYVNEDGVYPLTEELQTFLKHFYMANATWIDSLDNPFFAQLPADTAKGCEWMFPLYYYDAATPADPIVGTYNFITYTDRSDNTDTAGENDTPEEACTLTITDNNFTIALNSRMGSDTVYSGTWENANGTYTFTNTF